MKRFAALVMAVSAFFAISSCVKFDDSEIQSELTSIKSRLAALEDKVNTNISGLWEIVNAQKDGIIITSVTETDDSWILKFGNGKTATVSKGGTAIAPVVGVKKDADGIYCWTLYGQWLLDEGGNKLPVTGADGVTPRLKIEGGDWYVSTDGGKTWTRLGKAAGEDGDAFFKEVRIDGNFVYVTMSDGTEFVLRRGEGPVASIAVIPDYSDGAVKAGAGLFTIRFKVVPESAAEALLDLEPRFFKLDAVYTLTKAAEAGDLITLPVHKRTAEDGILTITTSGEDLDPGFASKKLGLSAALSISDGASLAVTSGYFPLWPKNEYMGHGYVDLGLESGNKFADTNLGAENPWEPGNFYAWGETGPKKNYSWATYKWCNGTEESITKYNEADGCRSFADDNYGDDAARQEWGGEWRTPTEEDWNELLDESKFKWTWTSREGRYGYEVTSRKPGYAGRSIFLPVTGTMAGTELQDNGSGYYWASTLHSAYPYAKTLYIYSSKRSAGAGSRSSGKVIRPVLGKYEAKTISGVSIAPGSLVLAVGMTRHLVARFVPEDADNPKVTWSSGNPGVATVAKDGTVTAVSLGEAAITVKTIDGGLTATCTVTVKHESELAPQAVDLGLPSGVKWANMNVGATSPDDPGDYFAWGETEPYYLPGHALDNPCTDWKPGKEGYRNSSYKWITSEYGGEYTKYCRSDKAMSFSVFNYEDDAARANWGGEWRTPTLVEMFELLDNCHWKFETENGNTVARGTSKINGNSIIIPAAGFRTYQNLKSYGNIATFMTTWLIASFHSYSVPFIHSGYYGYSLNSRFQGAPVRPVLGKEKHIPVTGIIPRETDITLIVGQTYQLSATVVPSNASKEQDLGWISADETIAEVDTFKGLVTAVSPGVTEVEIVAWQAERYVSATCKVTVQAPPEPDYVDMGLSVKWAKFNVGATSPEEFGDYFAWGETEPYYQDGYAYSASPLWKPGKEDGYYWTSYRWCNGSYDSLNKYNDSYSSGPTVDNLAALTAGDDAASVVMGDGWRMPTRAEWEELRNPQMCYWDCTQINGVPGYSVTSYITGNYIFLPAAGCRDEDRISNPATEGLFGQYWSSTLAEDQWNAYSLFFVDVSSGGGIFVHSNGRYYGYSVRAVHE